MLDTVVDAPDPILFKIIASHPQLCETDYRAFEAWCQADRLHDESTIDFMVRQGVFLKEAFKTIDMLRKGMLTYWDPKRIFGDQGHVRLRDYAQHMGYFDQKSDPHRALQAEARERTIPAQATPNRLSEVRDWLARRAEAKQSATIPTPLEMDSSQPPPSTVHAAPAVGTDSRPVVSPSGRPSPTPGLSQIPDRTSHVFGRKKFPEIGEQYGKYLLTEEVARGGTAVVFRALNRSLNSTVAIKVLKLDKDEGLNEDQAQMLESLRREAQMLARFNHPNLVRVYDLEEDAPFPFLVLEFVDGLSLYDMLAHAGRLRMDKAIRIMSAVCEGLSAAQRKIGMVHRDVKPGNILLARDGTIKLADLGLAMTTDTWSSSSNVNSSVLAGTAAYMAPELCTSGEVDLRTDIYSLGATFYHAVVGEMPFKGKNRMEIMLKHTRENPTPPHQLIAGADVMLSDVILRMMAKNPDDRYQLYEDLLTDLNELQTRCASEPQITLPTLASTAS